MVDQAGMTEYTGLSETQKTLPASWYYDASHFDREMRAIFHRHWIYVGHETLIPETGDYHCFDIADQKIVLLRNKEGAVNAFYNNCLHRGSVLCEGEAGSLSGKSIRCPYHQWTYNLEGKLTSTGRMARADDFNLSDYQLHKVHLVNWRGFLFINLSDDAPMDFNSISDMGFESYDNWPLEALIPVETYEKTLNCNWKVFWENYNECAHCPEIHPELIEMVPLYSRAIMIPEDDKNFEKYLDRDEAKYSGGLKDGARTWTRTGVPSAPIFDGLNEQELKEGFRFLTVMPSVFFVAHVDYVRVVQLIPLTPESMKLKVQWFYQKDAYEAGLCQPKEAIDFTKIVLEQDGHVAELNQAGMRNKPFKEGLLMPQEYELYNLHHWLKQQLNEV